MGPWKQTHMSELLFLGAEDINCLSVQIIHQPVMSRTMTES